MHPVHLRAAPFAKHFVAGRRTSGRGGQGTRRRLRSVWLGHRADMV